MKRIIFLMNFICCFLLSQEKKNEYTYLFFTKTKKDRTTNKILNEYINYDSDTIEYKLYYKNGETLSYPEIKINNSQTNKINFSTILADDKGIFYNNNNTRIVENKLEFLGKNFIVTKNYDDINWVITNEIDTINGYICKKAFYKEEQKGIEKTRTYTTTVWYNEEYELDIAPFGMVGLKGLIIKINFNNRQEVILDELKYKHRIKKIEPFKKGERITDKEFNQIMEDQMQKLRDGSSDFGILSDEY